VASKAEKEESAMIAAAVSSLAALDVSACLKALYHSADAAEGFLVTFPPLPLEH
jgi:hypothetical protein